MLFKEQRQKKSGIDCSDHLTLHELPQCTRPLSKEFNLSASYLEVVFSFYFLLFLERRFLHIRLHTNLYILKNHSHYFSIVKVISI